MRTVHEGHALAALVLVGMFSFAIFQADNCGCLPPGPDLETIGEVKKEPGGIFGDEHMHFEACSWSQEDPMEPSRTWGSPAGLG